MIKVINNNNIDFKTYVSGLNSQSLSISVMSNKLMCIKLCNYVDSNKLSINKYYDYSLLF